MRMTNNPFRIIKSGPSRILFVVAIFVAFLYLQSKLSYIATIAECKRSGGLAIFSDEKLDNIDWDHENYFDLKFRKFEIMPSNVLDYGGYVTFSKKRDYYIARRAYHTFSEIFYHQSMTYEWTLIRTKDNALIARYKDIFHGGNLMNFFIDEFIGGLYAYSPFDYKYNVCYYDFDGYLSPDGAGYKDLHTRLGIGRFVNWKRGEKTDE